MNILSVSVSEKKPYIRGAMSCLIVALAASFLSGHYGGPIMLFALLLGMSVNFLSTDEHSAEGINFAATFVLRFGVAMLGARILVEDVIDLGWAGVAVVIFGLVSTICFGSLFARVLKLDRKLGLLSGGAVAICGISAAMALSSVMPKSREVENYTCVTVVMVAAFGAVAMVAYPVIVQWLGLNVEEAGFFIGGSIHDVSHVVGASFSLSPEVGNSAMIVKMLRVAMLIPVVWVFFSLFKAEHGPSKADEVTLPVPFFLVAFVLIVLVNNLGLIPPQVSDMMGTVSGWCFVVAIGALGMKTSFQGLIEIGWRPIALVLAESTFLSLLMLGWLLI